MKLLKQTQLDQAAEILKNGGIIAFPTETVFGLGVVYDDKAAYDRLVATKRRPPEKPFTLMLADVEEIEKYAKLNSVSKNLINAFMPGQFTIIIEAQPNLPKWCVSEAGKVGIRIADYDMIRNLIRKTGKPLLVPSANKSGERPSTTSEEVSEVFKDELDAIVEGESVSNTPSTIVLLEGTQANVLREGVVSINQIKDVISKGAN